MTAASDVRSFKSIITLIVFVLTNIVVVFPFNIPVPFPASWLRVSKAGLVKFRVLEPYPHEQSTPAPRLKIPINFVTAPVAAVLFLLACTAIGREEVHDGIFGSDGIVPISIMAFFLALAYIAISLDHTGLIRWLAIWVIKTGGRSGKLLYLYLYCFYFALGTLFGNDPVVLSCTPFLAYMTRASENIKDPRAWIFAQLACANLSAAILVSANLTNLVLAGAFSISYITYTANMIVPVVLSGLCLFPFLLYVVFPSTELIPSAINLHALPDTGTNARGASGPEANTTHHDAPLDQSDTKVLAAQSRPSDTELALLLEPHLDRSAAIFGLVLFAITLVVLLATNAAGLNIEVYEITVPAAFVMLCRDAIDDYFFQRKRGPVNDLEGGIVFGGASVENVVGEKRVPAADSSLPESEPATDVNNDTRTTDASSGSSPTQRQDGPQTNVSIMPLDSPRDKNSKGGSTQSRTSDTTIAHPGVIEVPAHPSRAASTKNRTRHHSLQSLLTRALVAANTACPRACSVMLQLPFPLLPFTFGMFILVQGLVTKGWVHIFANGWASWVDASGTMGAIFGMGLVSVILCNFAGTNIGAAIVCSRVLQEWLKSHKPSDRTKQAAIYAMALGVNYGAFSAVFSASLAGLLWRSILERKGISVRSIDFVRYNLPIIAASMAVGCSVLAAQVYLVKDGHPSMQA